MAEENTVTMTVENIDRLFPEIVVNGESHVSENYVPPVQLEQSVPQTVEDEEEPSTPAQVVQGQDVHAVELNDVLHDFVDPSVTQGLADEIQTRRNADTALQNSINTINSKIPNQASAENQLADKNFVNSSIATNTANFLGTYTTLQEIEAIPNPTNNDYAYWDTTDSAGNTVYKRYKYNGESNEWLYEYDLNNSSFTAEQWATINSGLTQQSVDEDIQEAISQVGSGIEVYDTEEEMEEDLPNKQDGDLVGTLSTDDGELQDAPLGSVMPYLGTTDPSDGKWLVCDGRDTTGTAIELETHYPSLYMFLGGTNVLPDLREIVFVGAGQNGTETIANHDVYTVGQFKDDQIQNITGSVKIRRSVSGSVIPTIFDAQDSVSITANTTSTTYLGQAGSGGYSDQLNIDASRVARAGTTTHGKQIGVNYIIKAVSSADVYHAPASEITQIEQYFDSGLANTRMIPICTTESSTQTKEVTIAGFTLLAGVSFHVLFQNGCSAENPTLKINNETAKEIKVVQNGSKIAIPRHEGYWRGASSISYEVWQPNTILELMYDGTDFIVVGNPIVENYTGTVSSYTVFANGYKEQWGKVNSSGDGRTVAYPVKFTSSNFGIVSPNYNSTNATSFQKFAYNIGLTSLNASTGTAEAKWFVNGY